MQGVLILSLLFLAGYAIERLFDKKRTGISDPYAGMCIGLLVASCVGLYFGVGTGFWGFVLILGGAFLGFIGMGFVDS